MKQCPACKTIYTDQTLRFCLSDGSVLNEVGDEQSTVVRNVGEPFSEKTISMEHGGQVRIEIPGETSQTPPPMSFRPAAPAAGGSSGGLLKVLLVVLGLGIFAVLAVAVGTFIYFSRSEPEIASNVKNNKDIKMPAPTPTTNETDELRDQIANLEKLINEQKKNNRPANVQLTLPNQSTTTTTARANSPGDGFLALRTLPNSEAGERILKIPHGATVSVGACGPVVKPVTRTGRWCQAGYNGYTGWVFDAYLVYQK